MNNVYSFHTGIRRIDLTANQSREVRPLDVVVAAHAGYWVAQCLQYDITARAPTLEKIKSAFAEALAAEVVVCEELGKTLGDVPPGPRAFFEMYNKATPL